MKRCPQCGLRSPDELPVCACGRPFAADEAQAKDAPEVSEKDHARAARRAFRFGLLSAAYWIMLAYELSRPGRRGEGDSIVWLILAFLPMLGVSAIGAGISKDVLRRRPEDFRGSVGMFGSALVPLGALGFMLLQVLLAF